MLKIENSNLKEGEFMKKILSVLIGMAMALVTIGSVFAGDMINGAGATFPYPLYSAWAFAYEKETGIKLNYQSIGSGGGVRQVASRTVDFGASDDALRPEDIEKDKLLQWPQGVGGGVMAINIPR